MHKDLQARQDAMRQRLRRVNAPPIPRPVNYSKRVVYGPDAGMTPIFPEYFPERRARLSGVYMLTESGLLHRAERGCFRPPLEPFV